MVQDPQTLYKLMILYMLSRVNFPLTKAQIGDFILEKGYTNFLTLQQVISELIDADMIKAQTIRNRTHLTLTEEAVRTYDTNTKVNPPLRTKGDVDALIEGLKDGTIDCVATDHAPHTVEDKVVEYHYAANGISGFETALPVLWTELVQEGRLTAMELIDKMSTSAAKIMNLPAGTLETGAAADVIVIDPDTILAVDKNEFYSKGKNTPYHERLLSGWPMLTVVDGAVVMEDRKIKE